jgi:hypothetical protein
LAYNAPLTRLITHDHFWLHFLSVSVINFIEEIVILFLSHFVTLFWIWFIVTYGSPYWHFCYLFNPFSAKATFLSFTVRTPKRHFCRFWQTLIKECYAKTQFAIDTVNIYFNRKVTKLYLKFMILKLKWRHREIWRHNSPD